MKPFSSNIKGALWVLSSCVMFTCVNAIIKHVGQSMPVVQVVFLRTLFGTLLLMPAVYKHGLQIFKSENYKLQSLRLFCGAAGIGLMFYGLTVLPLAMTITLTFSRPLFMIPLAILMLAEKPGRFRVVATIVGFIGVVVVLRPDQGEISLAAVAVLASAVTGAFFMIVVKKLAAKDHPLTPLLWYTVGSMVLFAPFALWQWVSPDMAQLGWLFCAAILGTLGHYNLIRGYYLAEATVLNPIDYTQLIFSSLMGYYVFAELVSINTIVGGMVIVVSTWAILQRANRNSKLAKNKRQNEQIGQRPE